MFQVLYRTHRILKDWKVFNSVSKCLPNNPFTLIYCPDVFCIRTLRFLRGIILQIESHYYMDKAKPTLVFFRTHRQLYLKFTEMVKMISRIFCVFSISVTKTYRVVKLRKNIVLYSKVSLN